MPEPLEPNEVRLDGTLDELFEHLRVVESRAKMVRITWDMETTRLRKERNEARAASKANLDLAERRKKLLQSDHNFKVCTFTAEDGFWYCGTCGLNINERRFKGGLPQCSPDGGKHA